MVTARVCELLDVHHTGVLDLGHYFGFNVIDLFQTVILYLKNLKCEYDSFVFYKIFDFFIIC